MLRIDNNGTGTALDLHVRPGKQPLKVDSSRRVVNLNSDRLDGKDSTAFVPVDTYSVVDSRPGQGNGQIASRGASCDPGDMVLTGGHSSGGSDNLLASGPDGTRGWFVAVEDNGLDSLIRAEALCANFPPSRQ